MIFDPISTPPADIEPYIDRRKDIANDRANEPGVLVVVVGAFVLALLGLVTVSIVTG